MLSRVWRHLTCGVLHYSRWILGDNPFRLHQGNGLDDGVTHAKTPTTPGIRPRQPTEAEEKTVDETRQRVFRAIVGKAQWILRARLDVLYAVKDLSRRLQGPREVDCVAAKRMVKYLCGTRDTVLQLMPRKGTLRLHSVCGCPTSRKSSLGTMVWLNGALVSSLCKTQGLIALSSPEA